ncbi:MAG: hypothetical protein LBC74_14915 [Planctomycetaceae bacterium]|jgi:hypothetical protein|nr:hypothetical protein [Planctomycetaceae bacterium]
MLADFYVSGHLRKCLVMLAVIFTFYCVNCEKFLTENAVNAEQIDKTVKTKEGKKEPHPNASMENTFYPCFMRSPIDMTVNGNWKGFVCRASFTTTEADTVIRVRGGCIVLADSQVGLTSAILITDLDVTAVTIDAGGNPTFGTGEERMRGEGDIDKLITVATAGNHYIDFMYFDADQNTDDNTPATQVWGTIEYVGTKKGSDFTMDYTHGAGTSPGGLPLATPWLVLKLSKVTFGNGWDVVQDNGNGNYPEPHWKRDMTSNPLQPCPYLYSANATGKKTLRIKEAEWDVENGTAGNSFSVRSVGNDEINIPETNVTIANSKISISNINADNSFAVKTDFFNPFALDWQFKFPNPGKKELGWEKAGTSKNPIYVCLTSSPDLFYTPYRSVVHWACSNKGATTPNLSVDKTWDIFKTLDVKAWNETTKDFSRLLYYYKPGTTFTENAETVNDLLKSSLGTGRCGAWAALFYMACKMNGAADIDFVVANPRPPFSGFIIKDFENQVPTPTSDYNKFDFSLQTPPTPIPDMVPEPADKKYGDFLNKNTLPGQNSGTSAPSQKAFTNHAVIHYAGKYLDPSYGTEYISPEDFYDKAVVAIMYGYEVTPSGQLRWLVVPHRLPIKFILGAPPVGAN